MIAVLRNRFSELLIALLAFVAGGLATATQLDIELNVTPEAVRDGWMAGEVDPDAPQFFVSGQVGSSEGAVVELWDYARAINGGKHFPTFRQAIGDCVANGLANALNYGQAADIYFGRVAATEFHPVDRPWLYGVSRTDKEIGNGRLGSSDGSVGRWAVMAAKMRGVLAADANGVPPYSGERARSWGIRGPPEEFAWLAGPHTLETYAQVSTYEDVRDALANSYPVTIASNVGFQMQPVVSGGKHWGRPSGSWAHQMCLIGIDDTAVSPFTGEKGAAYCLNSWGDNAHGTPADDAPPGGFWIDRKTIERIVRQNDSWAVSGFAGFPARPKPDDFIIFDSGVDVEYDAVDPPVEVVACEALGFDRHTTGGFAGGAALLAALGAADTWRRRARRRALRECCRRHTAV